jgi:hypothetical protein
MASVQLDGQSAGLSPTAVSRPRDVAGQARDRNQALWLFIPLFYACFFWQLRPLGAPALLVVLGALVVSGFVHGRRYLSPALLVFAGLGLVYVLVSYLGLLGRGITLLFEPSAIAQQSAYALFLPFAVAAFAVYHEGVSQGRRAFVILETGVLMMAATAKLINSVAPGQDSLTGELLINYAGIFQLVTPVALLAFVLVRRTLQSPWATQGTMVALAIILLVTSSSAQGNIAMGILVPLVLLPNAKRTITFCFLLVLMAIPLIAWPYVQEIWLADPNTGIRLFFWHDALDRLWQSGGVGVGFGTETIRPLYALRTTDVSLSGIDDPNFILIGSHNAFIDAFYRMGVIGGGLLAIFVFSLFVKVVRGTIAQVNIMDCWVVCALATNLMVNVGLASFNFFFGNAFFMGWLMYRSASSQHRAIAYMPARVLAKGEAARPTR